MAFVVKQKPESVDLFHQTIHQAGAITAGLPGPIRFAPLERAGPQGRNGPTLQPPNPFERGGIGSGYPAVLILATNWAI